MGCTRGRIEGIVGNYDEVKQGEWRGGVEGALFYRQDDDVVVTDSEGNFITILKNGVENSYYNEAGEE